MGLLRFSQFVSNFRVNNKSLKTKFTIPRTKLTKDVLGVLYREGLIGGYQSSSSQSFDVFLKYFNGRSIFNKLHIFSTPGHSQVYSRKEIFRKFGPFSPEFFIFSTNKGAISNKNLLGSGHFQALRNLKVGSKFATKMFFLSKVFFVELYESAIYDIDFFSYDSSFNPISSESVKLNMDLITFFQKNERFFFYAAGDLNIRSFPARFLEFLERFNSTTYFVDFSNKQGFSFIIKFIILFLFNLSRFFSFDYIPFLLKKGLIAYSVLQRILFNFFFSSLYLLNLVFLFSQNAIFGHKFFIDFFCQSNNFLFGNQNMVSVPELFNEKFLFIRKCFLACANLLRLKNGFLVSKNEEFFSFFFSFYILKKKMFFDSILKYRFNFFFSFFLKNFSVMRNFKTEEIAFPFRLLYFDSLFLVFFALNSRSVSKNFFSNFFFNVDSNKHLSGLNLLKYSVYFFLSGLFKEQIIVFFERPLLEKSILGKEQLSVKDLRKYSFLDGGILLLSLV